MNAGSQAIPIVCNMSVFMPDERELHIQAASRLLQSLQDVHEAENGFEFAFPNESEVITRMAEFIAKERLCCPFLEFTLKIPADSGPIALFLTGPEGTKEFLREEFSEAFI